jgi:hypothetical protein
VTGHAGSVPVPTTPGGRFNAIRHAAEALTVQGELTPHAEAGLLEAALAAGLDEKTATAAIGLGAKAGRQEIHGGGTGKWRPFPPVSSEDELATRILARLEPHFHAEREVRGRHCTGKRMRLDAVLTPCDPAPWFDVAPALGVEFKLPDGTGDLMRWERQAEDYAHVGWPRYGRITVFTCPPVTQILARITAWGPNAPGLMARWIGQAGVGELGLTGAGLTFKVSGHELWSEKWGLHQQRSLIPKTGSR